VTTNEFDGEPDGVLFRVGELNAESITFGARPGPVRPRPRCPGVAWPTGSAAAVRRGSGVVVLHSGCDDQGRARGRPTHDHRPGPWSPWRLLGRW